MEKTIIQLDKEAASRNAQLYTELSPAAQYATSFIERWYDTHPSGKSYSKEQLRKNIVERFPNLPEAEVRQAIYEANGWMFPTSAAKKADLPIRINPNDKEDFREDAFGQKPITDNVKPNKSDESGADLKLSDDFRSAKEKKMSNVIKVSEKKADLQLEITNDEEYVQEFEDMVVTLEAIRTRPMDRHAEILREEKNRIVDLMKYLGEE